MRRVADESDGRATRLVVTDAGLAALEQLGRDRAAVLERVTADWDDDDLATFTDLLGRFLDDLAAALPGDAAATPRTGRPPMSQTTAADRRQPGARAAAAPTPTARSPTGRSSRSWSA